MGDGDSRFTNKDHSILKRVFFSLIECFVIIMIALHKCICWLELGLRKAHGVMWPMDLLFNYLPLGKGVTLHLNRFECALPWNALCYCQIILEEIFSLFCFFLPLKSHRPSFEWPWISFTHRCFMPSLVDIDLMVLDKNTWRCESLQRDRLKDNMKPLTWAFCLRVGELKCNISNIIVYIIRYI